MQRFNAPLTPSDKAIARRVGRIVLIVYSSAALVLSAVVLVGLAQKAASTASNSTGTPAAAQATGGATLISEQSSLQAHDVSHNPASRSIVRSPNHDGD
jgi:hypothetical protein